MRKDAHPGLLMTASMPRDYLGSWSHSHSLPSKSSNSKFTEGKHSPRACTKELLLVGKAQ